MISTQHDDLKENTQNKHHWAKQKKEPKVSRLNTSEKANRQHQADRHENKLETEKRKERKGKN